jgi:hypothetical protein
MRIGNQVLGGWAAFALLAALAPAASGSTFVRAGLDELVEANGTILVADVVDVHSYWNEDKTFILTDVTLAPTEVVKGRAAREVTVTLMGGRVGETTALVLGVPVLLPGRSYVLFLNRESLPGGTVLTVRDHVQGAFDIVDSPEGPRAVSQANSHPLLPDLFGDASPPGGEKGLALPSMLQTLRTIDRSSR